MRHPRRILEENDRPIVAVDLVLDARDRGHEVQIELSLQALLDDLHVEETEEAGAEAEPRAVNVSGSYWSDASLSCSFSSASRRFSYAAVSVGYNPANTIDRTSRYPGSGRAAGAGRVEDRVADPCLRHVTHVRDHVAHLARARGSERGTWRSRL